MAPLISLSMSTLLESLRPGKSTKWIERSTRSTSGLRLNGYKDDNRPVKAPLQLTEVNLLLSIEMSLLTPMYLIPHRKRYVFCGQSDTEKAELLEERLYKQLWIPRATFMFYPKEKVQLIS